MINFIICDDDKKIIEQIKKIISNFMMKNECSYKTYFFDDYDSKFMKMINSKLQCKIYILDIETPTRSGIDIARLIREKDVDSMIIFLTGHEELGSTILKNDLMFLSFINKFDNCEKRLIDSIKSALKMFHKRNILKFKDGNTFYTISMDDIIYITRDSIERKCIVKTEHYEFKSYKTIKEFEELLDDRFIKTHRACIVNKDKIVKIDIPKKEILLNNGEKIALVSPKLVKGVLV
ncbi:MAG: response regulator transcription factor [Firmicutes bacterium]|nr:response regulator transcription factor [Bacillota bacterium]